jgi:DNA-binding NarL/FixJ family response regulator
MESRNQSKTPSASPTNKSRFDDQELLQRIAMLFRKGKDTKAIGEALKLPEATIAALLPAALRLNK